jgi:hypothetical protein
MEALLNLKGTSVFVDGCKQKSLMRWTIAIFVLMRAKRVPEKRNKLPSKN